MGKSQHPLKIFIDAPARFFIKCALRTPNNNNTMSTTLLAEVEESIDLNLSLEELDAILENDVVNSVPPFVNQT